MTLLVSMVVPSPLIDALSTWTRSIRITKRPLLSRLLNANELVVANISAMVAAAPLHCLSQYMTTRTVSDEEDAPVADGRVTSYLHRILRITERLPTLVDSLVPLAMLLMESDKMTPPVAITASVVFSEISFCSCL